MFHIEKLPTQTRHTTMTASIFSQRLLDLLTNAGLPFGAEASFKLTQGHMLADRLMLGVRAKHAPWPVVADIAQQLGMPAPLLPLLSAHHTDADVVLFGMEQGPDQCVFKIYLEFWNKVARDVMATRDRTPQLLDLGIKWVAGEAQARVAKYWCYPLLSPAECSDRLRLLYGVPTQASEAFDLANSLLVSAAQQRPGASFIYIEVEETGTPRRSFDLNIYKAGLRMCDAQAWLDQLAAHFKPPAEAFATLMSNIAQHPLGHISGGTDRHGQDFLTVYHEVSPLD